MRYKKALLILALVTCLTACAKSSTSNDTDGAHYWDADGNPITFSGTVGKGDETDMADNDDTMVSEGFFLPCSNGSYLLIIDNYGPNEMFPENGDNSIYDDLSVGDTIKVTHSEIEETYPGRMTIYSIEKISDGDLSDIPVDTLTNLEELGWIALSNNSETIQPTQNNDDMTPTVLDRETDRRIRSDYAAYVSARDNKEITADWVTGQFYYGNDNGYMLLVMCPSNSYTEDIREYNLQIMDIPDDDCDCYPYDYVVLPSGMFEMLAYKDGTFIDIETAISEKLISYDAVSSIVSYMDLYYTEGNQICVYKTNYIDN